MPAPDRQQTLSAIAALESYRKVDLDSGDADLAAQVRALAAAGLVEIAPSDASGEDFVDLSLTLAGADVMIEGEPWRAAGFRPAAPGPLADAWFAVAAYGWDARRLVSERDRDSRMIVVRRPEFETGDLRSVRPLWSFHDGCRSSLVAWAPSKLDLGLRDFWNQLDDLGARGFEVAFGRKGGRWLCSAARGGRSAAVDRGWDECFDPWFEHENWQGAYMIRAMAAVVAEQG
jgi:hypothetical protein